MINLDRNICYFSIESRKGGVGKTTVSLSLAQNLLMKSYQVLYVDLDLIGTQLSDAFFKGKEKYLHEVKNGSHPANLVELYKQMLGSSNNVPKFILSKNSNEDNVLIAKEGVCNCLTSNIYNNPSSRGKSSVLLDDPRLLYDSFHAFWMLELVKELASSFSDLFSDKTKVAVILDHSPGYSSIESVFHDFLTDIGPEYGKFIFVSSIDAQDLDACRQSVGNLEEISDDKEKAWCYYRSFFSPDIQAEKVESDYFESVFSRLCSSSGKEPAYFSEDILKKTPFTITLVNKIPRKIYERERLGQKAAFEKRKRVLSEKEIPAPFLGHLQFFYNEWLFRERDLLKNGRRNKRYKLIGKLDSISRDEETYNSFLGRKSLSEQYGDFLKQEWSPLAPFEDLLKYMKDEELVDEIVDVDAVVIEYFRSHKINQQDLKYEIVVEDFIMNNLECKDIFSERLKKVKEEVVNRIEKSKHSKGVSFHLDSEEDDEILKESEKLFLLFGLAVYRLMNYEKSSALISSLIENLNRDSSIVDRMDQHELSDKISKALEGRFDEGEDLYEKIKEIIAEQYNLSVLNSSLDRVLQELKVV